MERDSCRSIFTDFADLAGRPLLARLETLSVSPAEYLQFIGFAQTIVIHETLHSLGLGENPPSSADITARVVARCGR